jgi:hypothetical protein
MGRGCTWKFLRGVEEWFAVYAVLLLLETLCGLKQAAMVFWREFLKAFKSMGFNRSKVDPCLYFKWTQHSLLVWVSSIDDCLVIGKAEGMKHTKNQLMEIFDCDEVGNMDKYMGCKIDRGDDEKGPYLKITQPVLLQSYHDEFNLPEGLVPNTPAEPESVLVKVQEGNGLDMKAQKTCRSGVGKLLYMRRWSRPDVLNATRELSKSMMVASQAYMKVMQRTMQYYLNTPNRGILLQPNEHWGGNPEFESTVSGKSDSDYAKDHDTSHSVLGGIAYLCGAPVSMRSAGQKIVALSVTKAELVAVGQVAQDILFVMRLMESIVLKVKTPMLMWITREQLI